MRKELLSILSFGFCAASLLTPADICAEIVTAVPDGGTVKTYERSGMAFKGSKTPAEFSAMTTEVVEYADGTVYWKNPVSQIGTSTQPEKDAANAYIKGTIEGDQMTFTLPQDLATVSTFSGVQVIVKCQMLVPDFSNRFDPTAKPAADQACVFKKDADGKWVMQNSSETLVIGALGGFGGESVFGYGDYNVVLTPSAEPSEQPVAFPEGAVTEDWAMFSGGSGRFVKVFVDGNDIYVGGIFADMPNAVVEGTVADGVCTFASGQYLGMGPTGQLYYSAALYERYTDEAADTSYWRYLFKPGFEFTYDASAKALTAKEAWQFVAASDVTVEADRYPIYHAAADKIAWQPAEIDNTPGPLTLKDYTPYNAKEKEGYIDFTFPAANKDGYLLDTSKLSYRVLVDDKVLEMTSAEYYGIKEGLTLTEIPYVYPYSTDITNYGTIFGVRSTGSDFSFTFFMNDFTFLGVQAIYTTENGPIYSAILSVNGADVPAAWNPAAPELLVDGVPAEGETVEIVSGKEISFTVKPGETIYYSWTPAAEPEAANAPAEGFQEYKEPIKVTSAGTLKYYAENAAGVSETKTLAVTLKAAVSYPAGIVLVTPEPGSKLTEPITEIVFTFDGNQYIMSADTPIITVNGTETLKGKGNMNFSGGDGNMSNNHIITFAVPENFKWKAGENTLLFERKEAETSVTNVIPDSYEFVYIADTKVGVDGVNIDFSGADYYTLEGVKVAQPEAGKIYIKVANAKSSKVIKR